MDIIKLITDRRVAERIIESLNVFLNDCNEKKISFNDATPVLSINISDEKQKLKICVYISVYAALKLPDDYKPVYNPYAKYETNNSVYYKQNAEHEFLKGISRRNLTRLNRTAYLYRSDLNSIDCKLYELYNFIKSSFATNKLHTLITLNNNVVSTDFLLNELEKYITAKNLLNIYNVDASDLFI